MIQKSVKETKLICPECSAVIITKHPEIILWERCPACNSHIWDDYDLMMAEVLPERSARANRANSLMRSPLH